MTIKYLDGKFILTLQKEEYKVLLRSLLNAKEADARVEELLENIRDEHELMSIDLDAIAKEEILKEIPF